MSDTFRPKPALKRCAVCHLPVARKKLVFAAGGTAGAPRLPVGHGPLADRSAAPPGLTRAPKDISRAELLKKIEALRKRDAKMKPGAAKVQPADRPKQPTAPHCGKRPVPPPQPFYGVEMKFINGRWVQVHPDSE
ncbi:hypothetical protein ACFYMX_15970 [Streptomyces griseofuscus]|uniref:hypothetical protein n=1 Tax=Streptomyces TaxID=1883 RepID=UPI0018F06547|nr:hypothetical protein [Streptomyces sp. CRPSP2-6A1]MBJ7004974.1 hypothetical protein [Streptomyces sp. CRPSP2-6A1]